MKVKHTLWVAAGLLLGCLGETEPPAPEGDGFRLGTSFGMCAGYCVSEIEAKPGSLIFRTSSGGRGGPLPEIVTQSTLSDGDWNALAAAFDAGAFNSLDTLIGCPDCADGGAEWVTGGSSARKVTYEYGKPLEGLEGFQSKLRDLMDRGHGAALCGYVEHGQFPAAGGSLWAHFRALRLGPMDHEAAAQRVEAYLLGKSCVEKVEIIPGFAKPLPIVKELKVTFKQPQGSVIKVLDLIIEDDGTWVFRIH